MRCALGKNKVSSTHSVVVELVEDVAEECKRRLRELCRLLRLSRRGPARTHPHVRDNPQPVEDQPVSSSHPGQTPPTATLDKDYTRTSLRHITRRAAIPYPKHITSHDTPQHTKPYYSTPCTPHQTILLHTIHTTPYHTIPHHIHHAYE